MKKTISFLLSILMLFSITAGLDFSAYAETDASGDYEYQLLKDGTMEITKYKGSATSITIPSTLGGYKVTSIGNWSFARCKNLTSVNIPDSVTTIAQSAFYGCENLIGVTIPNSVTSIGDGAFSQCISLPSITLPNSVTSIGSSAFSGCISLTGLAISSSITCIPDAAFANCSSLINVTIPNGVTSIDEGAFYKCTRLKNVIIPNSVITIRTDAFYGCTSLTGVTIPKSVTFISEDAFYGCTSLISIIAASDNEKYSSVNGVLFNKDKTQLLLYPIGSTWRSYTIPNSVTFIGSYAFAKAVLTNIHIPSSVTGIGAYAFSDCVNVKEIKLPNSIKDIWQGAFEGCRSLNNLTIPGSVTKIDTDTFMGCVSLINITIPNSVTIIGRYAFCGCSGLASLTIPKSVTSIGGDAFSGCENLKNIKVDSGNKKYSSSDGVLYNKSKTELIKYPAGNTRTSYIIPNSVKRIGDKAFEFCFNLKQVYYASTAAQWNKVSKFASNDEWLKNVICKSGGAWVNTKQKKADVRKLTKAKKSFKAAWKKVSGVTGYQIQYSTSKKFTKKTTKSVTVSSNKAKSPSKTVKKLKGKKTYYVRIRTYKTTKLNGKSTKVYSSWSKAKSVKTK